MKNFNTYQRKQEGALLGDILLYTEYSLMTKHYIDSSIPRTKKEFFDYELYCIRNHYQPASWGYYWQQVFNAYWNIRHCYDTFSEFLEAHELTDYNERYI